MMLNNERGDLVSKGRPKKEESMTEFVGFRLSKEDLKELERMISVTGKTKTEIIKEGFKMQVNLFRHKYD